MKRFLVLSILMLTFSFSNSRSIEDHPKYTAARLADEYKHILDGKIKLSDSHVISEDITVDDCGKGGNYDYLSEKLNALIPKLSQTELFVKFAYPVPFTNNSIQFSVDEVLTHFNGEKESGEKAFFARLDDKDDEYRIYDIRVVPCNP